MEHCCGTQERLDFGTQRELLPVTRRRVPLTQSQHGFTRKYRRRIGCGEPRRRHRSRVEQWPLEALTTIGDTI
jgi:hypothetical protein